MSQSTLRGKLSAPDSPDALSPRAPFEPSPKRVAEIGVERPRDGRMSETNRGLRMILIAAVAVALISWGGTVAGQYIRYLEIQQLAATDQDALRVMCAHNPPTEHQIGWMHICEAAALGETKADQEAKQAEN